MKNVFHGIALLLFALLLAVVGLVSDGILLAVSLAVGVLGIIVSFWDGIRALWHKLTVEAEDGKDNS